MVARFPDGVLQQAVDAECSCNGSKEEAARLIGINVNTFKHRLKEAKRLGLVPKTAPAATVPAAVASTIETLQAEVERLRDELKKAQRPHFTIRQDIRGETDTYRVLVMGDAHDDPTIPDKSRFHWAGKYCAEQKHDVLLSIGDFLNMNSLCFHIPDENYTGRAKGTFIADIASGKEAFDALNAGLGNWKPERHMTVGNHENRLYRAEDKAPASWGMYHALFDEMMTGAGFTYSPYGADHLIGGVIFTHIPQTIMGKPYSGRHLNSLGNDATKDMVTGHRHRAARHPFAKLFRETVTLVDCGCYLPNGHVEDFADHTPGLWDYCLTDILIKNRKIVDVNFISALTLEERYAS